MLDQVTTFERCRWQTGDGQCPTLTNHVYQTENLRGDKIEFPCCVKHQSDASATFEMHREDIKFESSIIRVVQGWRDEDEEEEEPYVIVVGGGGREVYDSHRTEKPTSYLFRPSAKSKKSIARVAKALTPVAMKANPELLAAILAFTKPAVAA